MFTPEERTYLNSQRLARLATVAPDGQPTVDAVGFWLEGDQFVIGGRDLPSTRKYRNIAAGNQQVALIIDDVLATEPWTVRGIKVHGTAEIVERDGFFGAGKYFLITPHVSWSWGVVKPTFDEGRFAPHKIVWSPATAESMAR
jgi:pyridoxamine 5'-phosphate oxidase family protein